MGVSSLADAIDLGDAGAVSPPGFGETGALEAMSEAVGGAGTTVEGALDADSRDGAGDGGGGDLDA